MNLPLPGATGPAAGFDQPFELLAGCHERVRRSLALLQRLVAHIAQHGIEARGRSAAQDVLRYSDITFPSVDLQVNEEARRAMGTEMAHRRGVKVPTSGDDK